jgi:hypothetical protein
MWVSQNSTECEVIDIVVVGRHSKIFVYDKKFGEVSTEADLAWKGLFPRHGGFFNHPTIAPQRSTFAVFHQLHCLVRNSRVQSGSLTDKFTYRMGSEKDTGRYTKP